MIIFLLDIVVYGWETTVSCKPIKFKSRESESSITYYENKYHIDSKAVNNGTTSYFSDSDCSTTYTIVQLLSSSIKSTTIPLLVLVRSVIKVVAVLVGAVEH